MESYTLFAVGDSHFSELPRVHGIGGPLERSIAANLETFVTVPGMQLALFDQKLRPDRPTGLALGQDGTLVAVYISGLDQDIETLPARIRASEAWLETQELRDLAQLFTVPSIFYEGLLDMSPNKTIALQRQRRSVVITADPALDRAPLVEAVGNGVLNLVVLDVFDGNDGRGPIVRWNEALLGPPPVPPAIPIDIRPGSPRPPSGPPTAAEPQSIEPQSISIIDLSGGASLEQPIPGQSYLTDTLPTLFDPAGQTFDSISDEMFSIPGHLVLVDKIQDRRRRSSAFESSERYRWDATTTQEGLLRHHHDAGPERSQLHLFVEADRQPGVATYVGTLEEERNIDRQVSESMCFSVTPAIDAALLKAFRRGRLPDLTEKRSVQSHEPTSVS